MTSWRQQISILGKKNAAGKKIIETRARGRGPGDGGENPALSTARKNLSLKTGKSCRGDAVHREFLRKHALYPSMRN